MFHLIFTLWSHALTGELKGARLLTSACEKHSPPLCALSLPLARPLSPVAVFHSPSRSSWSASRPFAPATLLFP